jgi:K+-sensing histidine kinase KdpD
VGGLGTVAVVGAADVDAVVADGCAVRLVDEQATTNTAASARPTTR